MKNEKLVALLLRGEKMDTHKHQLTSSDALQLTLLNASQLILLDDHHLTVTGAMKSIRMITKMWGE